MAGPDREAGRVGPVELYDRWADELAAFADADLTPDERIDRDLLIGEMERTASSRRRSGKRWSPLEWVYMMGDGLFSLIAREFAPLPDRLDVDREPDRGAAGGPRGRPRR